MTMRRPPGRNLADAATDQRVGGAYAAMRGGEPDEAPQEEQQENQLLAELKQLLARAVEILAQMEQGKPAAGPEDTGSPSAQGMP